MFSPYKGRGSFNYKINFPAPPKPLFVSLFIYVLYYTLSRLTEFLLLIYLGLSLSLRQNSTHSPLQRDSFTVCDSASVPRSTPLETPSHRGFSLLFHDPGLYSSPYREDYSSSFGHMDLMFLVSSALYLNVSVVSGTFPNPKRK